jgi:hypothetical protein
MYCGKYALPSLLWGRGLRNRPMSYVGKKYEREIIQRGKF